MDSYITVGGRVATWWVKGERVGEWEADARLYEAAGIEGYEPLCGCDPARCCCGLAHFWGRAPSFIEELAMIEAGRVFPAEMEAELAKTHSNLP